ncbi:hypothetical protein EVAR_41161_1 [Eumeta japonica]|uniref:Uncharacterized protein n=1 Tax=Eumeta variegata TaxID=151549 RepID=A0A4C1YD90_EUMVA|nr:hypothetical protein EVAR_41161_1 [Eumeta japonica]
MAESRARQPISLPFYSQFVGNVCHYVHTEKLRGECRNRSAFRNSVARLDVNDCFPEQGKSLDILFPDVVQLPQPVATLTV